MHFISALPSILSSLVFSTFSILPLSGRMAWKCLSLPSLAEPPALSPSTMNNSHFEGSFSEQSASFPGNAALSRTDFLLVSSRAFLAASLARLALRHLSTIVLACAGCSSMYCMSPAYTALSTMFLI